LGGGGEHGKVRTWTWTPDGVVVLGEGPRRLGRGCIGARARTTWRGGVVELRRGSGARTVPWLSMAGSTATGARGGAEDEALGCCGCGDIAGAISGVTVLGMSTRRGRQRMALA
jgi:hypothetical protein